MKFTDVLLDQKKRVLAEAGSYGKDPNSLDIPRLSWRAASRFSRWWEAQLYRILLSKVLMTSGITEEAKEIFLSDAKRWRKIEDDLGLPISPPFEMARFDLLPVEKALLWWNETGRLAISLDVTETAPTKWELVKESIEETLNPKGETPWWKWILYGGIVGVGFLALRELLAVGHSGADLYQKLRR